MSVKGIEEWVNRHGWVGVWSTFYDMCWLRISGVRCRIQGAPERVGRTVTFQGRVFSLSLRARVSISIFR